MYCAREKENIMTIIVTGGAGFIGSNFIFHMLKKYPDYRIICLDCLTYAGNLSTLAPVMDNKNFRFVKEDITNREGVYRLFEEEKPDIVVNFAAESHVDRSIENPEVFLDTNIKGTAVLMDACRKYGITRYHQVSTDEVYGDLPLDRPDLFFTEETPLHTSSPYSSSKASPDLFVLAYHRTYGLPVTISRCSNNYGPYHFPEKLIPLMISRALADSGITSMADMAGKTMEQNPSAYEYQMLMAYNDAHPGQELNIVAVSDQSTADTFLKVSNGQVDASLTYKATFDSVVPELGIDNLTLTDVVMCEDTYLMFPKTEQQLCDDIDAVLKEMIADGTISKISEKWYGEDVFGLYADMVSITAK